MLPTRCSENCQKSGTVQWHSRRSRAGFTLVELLVVIGIIALLISMLLPALAGAKKHAASVKCMSNLHQIGIGIMIYANNNKGSLPFGYYTDDANALNSYDWTIKVLESMNSKQTGANFSTVQDRSVFSCPSSNSDNAAPASVVNHYSCHPRLMPDFEKPVPPAAPVNDPATGAPPAPYKLSRLKHSSDLILAFDGTQYWRVQGVPDGNASAVAYGLDNWRCGTNGSWSNELTDFYNTYDDQTNPSDWIDGGVNLDSINWSGDGYFTVRWRHGTAKLAKCNFLFVDGHVNSLTYKSRSNHEIKAKNIICPHP